MTRSRADAYFQRPTTFEKQTLSSVLSRMRKPWILELANNVQRSKFTYRDEEDHLTIDARQQCHRSASKSKMSSSQPFQPSSPLSTGSIRKTKSRFTYRQLAQLGTSSTTCPLRVVAHVDLDAFYAQCEMVRLDVVEDQPLAVQQW